MSNGDLINCWAVGNNGLPAPTTEGAQRPIRSSNRGELITQPLHGMKMYPVADEGSYYKANSPTPGTGIIDTAALTAFVATTPTAVIYNSNATVNGVPGKSIYLDYMRLTVTAAGTSGTNWFQQHYIDQINRYTSGGSLLTAVNPNALSTATSGAVIHFGAITAPAAGANVRLVDHELGRTVIKVIGDTYLFDFGGSARASNAGMPTDGTLQLNKVFTCAPIVIGPGCSWVWYEWAASQGTAAGFEVNIGYTER